MEYREIILNEECDNWIDAINKVAYPLLDKNLIKQNYIDTMVEYNKKYHAYFVISKSIALVHARPEDGVLKNCFSVMTLKTPVNFGNEENDPVKLVICMASVDSVGHIELMKKIMRVIEDNKLYDEIINSKSKKNVLAKFL